MRALLLLSFILFSIPAHAGSFGVAPTTIVVPSGSKTGVFYVTNRGSVPMVAQVEGFDWRQKDGVDELSPSDTLLVSPPMVKLAPKQQQTIRFAIKGNDEKAERTYRLIVSELPDHSAKSPQSTIQMLLQFSIPVFVAGSEEGQTALEWDVKPTEQGTTVLARNTGAKTVKLSSITLAAGEAKPTEVSPKSFNYILPGASHEWVLQALNLQANEPVHIRAYDDRDNATINANVTAGK